MTHPFIFFSEHGKYSVIQISATTWYVLHNEDLEYLADGRIHKSLFHLLPVFKRVYVVTLLDGILLCDCDWGFRFGIPCRHLFSVEPCYDKRDVDCRWHVAYAYYAYAPGHEELTKLYEKRAKTEHCGIILKSFTPSASFPSKHDGCKHEVDDFVEILESPVPLLWNYLVDSYPQKYQQRVSCVSSDSEDSGFGMDSCGLTQESVPVGMVDYSPNESMAYVRTRGVKDCEIFTQLKTMLPIFDTGDSRGELLDQLREIERKRRVDVISGQKMTTNNAKVEQDYVSAHLPMGKQKESRQINRKKCRR